MQYKKIPIIILELFKKTMYSTIRNFLFFGLLVIIISPYLYAQKTQDDSTTYIIRDVRYSFRGVIREYAAKQLLKIREGRQFESYKQLTEFISDKNEIINNYTFLQPISGVVFNSIYDIEQKVYFVDIDVYLLVKLTAFPFGIVDYESNEGLTIGLAGADSNFLGLLNSTALFLTFSYTNQNEFLIAPFLSSTVPLGVYFLNKDRYIEGFGYFAERFLFGFNTESLSNLTNIGSRFFLRMNSNFSFSFGAFQRFAFRSGSYNLSNNELSVGANTKTPLNSKAFSSLRYSVSTTFRSFFNLSSEYTLPENNEGLVYELSQRLSTGRLTTNEVWLRTGLYTSVKNNSFYSSYYEGFSNHSTVTLTAYRSFFSFLELSARFGGIYRVYAYPSKPPIVRALGAIPGSVNLSEYELGYLLRGVYDDAFDANSALYANFDAFFLLLSFPQAVTLHLGMFSDIGLRLDSNLNTNNSHNYALTSGVSLATYLNFIRGFRLEVKFGFNMLDIFNDANVESEDLEVSVSTRRFY